MENQRKGMDLKIPEGVTVIRPYAYQDGQDLCSVSIPASMTQIGEGAFDGCVNLEDITVHVDNLYYSDDFGVLYNKDGTKLIRVPQNHMGVLVLDQKIQAIAPGALKGCHGVNAILCDEPVYPLLQAELARNPVKAHVSIVDSCGVMLNPEKTCLEAALYPLFGSYTVPDGVQTIWGFASIMGNEDFTDFTDIIIPASVTRIAPTAFDCCPNVTIHGPEGSYGIDFAKKHGIPYVIL